MNFMLPSVSKLSAKMLDRRYDGGVTWGRQWDEIFANSSY